MQSWREMVKQYDKSIRDISGRIELLDSELEQAAEGSAEWHTIANRLETLEYMRGDLMDALREIRDRNTWI